MALDANNILQADATVIADILILLTLLSFKSTKVEKDQLEQLRRLKQDLLTEGLKLAEKRDRSWDQSAIQSIDNQLIEYDLRNRLSIMTIGAISPFCVSAILIVLGYLEPGKYVMGIGFMFLIVAVYLLVRLYRRVL